MALIAGAGRYLTAATLANTRGISPSVPNVLGGDLNVASILDSARNTLAIPGIGPSANSRALTQQFLSRTADINSMFSLGLGAGATIEGLQQQILALRATLPLSRLATSVLDLSSLDDDTTVPAGSNGQQVDTEA